MQACWWWSEGTQRLMPNCNCEAALQDSAGEM